MDEHCSTPVRRLFTGFKFRVCDQAIFDPTNKSCPYEPHIPFVLYSNSEQTVKWVDHFIPGEVGSDDAEILAQSANYTRYRFVSCQSLLFCPIITFNRVSGVARVCFFHRGGVNSTSPCTITGAARNIVDFVEAIVGILLWKDSLAAGMDRHRTDYSIYSTRFERFYIIACIYAMKSLRGRATRIYRAIPTGNLNEVEGNKFRDQCLTILPIVAHVNLSGRSLCRGEPADERKVRSAR